MDTRSLESLIVSVAKTIVEIEKGTILTHLFLGEALKVQPTGHKYYSRVSKLKKELETSHNLFLNTENGQGYRICRPGEEINILVSPFYRGVKMMGRSVKRTRNILLDGMSEDDKRRTISTSQSMALIASATLNSVRKEISDNKIATGSYSSNMALLEQLGH